MMPHVVVTDSCFVPLHIETPILEAAGLSVQLCQCRTQQELLSVVPQADFLATQYAPIDRAVVAALDRCQVIVRYGIGVDNVDLAAARQKGIPVCNVPDYCIDEVADHAVALLLAGTRQVLANADAVRGGDWKLPVPLSQMKTLRELSVGVVGFGRIGRAVCQRLRAFGCALQVHDPGVEPAEIAAAGCAPVGLSEIWANSDAITLHCPANEHTHHLVDAEAIAAMKNGVILVNVARGSIISTDCLVAALERGKIGFAGLDVTEVEPLPPDHPLRSLGNAVVHSHVASASEAAYTTLRRRVAETIVTAHQGQPLPNVVNGITNVAAHT